MGETIVVIGAGVTGLTTALLLSRDKSHKVTVVAKHMPGDYDIEYASPFAGANILPMATKKDKSWETRTWYEMKRLCETVPEAGINFQKCTLLRREKDNKNQVFPEGLFDPSPWFRELYDDYRDLPKNEIPDGFDSASDWTNVCINTAIYLPWLVGQLLKNGVVLKRANLSHIEEAKSLSHTEKPASLIINATGLGSLKLGGVEDTKMAPARGQVVIVRNEAPMTGLSGTDDDANDACYVMTRAAGGGTILGGTYHIGNWESQPDPNVAQRIMSRIVKQLPGIAGGKGVAGLDVIRHAVGLRPYRHGGVRIEKEILDDQTWIIHNYGHAGWGYQGSWGCAEDVVDLAKSIPRPTKAKL
ncbi:unnamed protein product [Clonostachys rosea f. rosea IK726]|uniref:FAD dependent oxidoreductase domain-containing protein n=2 Tax=Bionectria ochroleuca TaxID=29856 RepID=A0A0B7JUU2_BIOOC|nr:unnamed protein product [Clonostachys rosea f. rosea IK726]